jgi:hypothetical protein
VGLPTQEAGGRRPTIKKYCIGHSGADCACCLPGATTGLEAASAIPDPCVNNSDIVYCSQFGHVDIIASLDDPVSDPVLHGSTEGQPDFIFVPERCYMACGQTMCNEQDSQANTACTASQQIDTQTCFCVCADCESRPSVNEVQLTLHVQGPTFEEILATGWPLSTVISPADQQTLECFHIYDTVRVSGVPNFLSLRVSLPHGLNIPQWRGYLKGYTDVSLVDFLDFGFPVGFDSKFPLISTYSNHASAQNYPEHVQYYLDTECQEGAMLGPFDSTPFWPWLHISPLMTRDKKNSTKRRVIVDLSWPHHASVNGGTPLETYLNEPYKLHLPTTEDLAVVIAHYGPGCGLWARDLRRAYRQWRIDPLDWPLMGIKVGEHYYVDTAVAFGLRHGAAFAQRVSQAVCDILGRQQHTAIPYIDDLVGAAPTVQAAAQGFHRSGELLDELGLQQAVEKSTSPTTCLTWIGVRFDTENMTMAIPSAVIADTGLLVEEWMHKLRATRHDLQVLLGKLFHSAKCSGVARLFVGRMLATLRTAPATGSVPLSREFRADLRWFRDFLPHYNGFSLIHTQRTLDHVYLDTSMGLLSTQWSTEICTAPVPQWLARPATTLNYVALFTLLIALELWAPHWDNVQLNVHTDQPQTLDILLHGRSRDDYALHVARAIWHFVATHDILIFPCATLSTDVVPTPTKFLAIPSMPTPDLGGL